MKQEPASDDDADFYRWYGPWRSTTPRAVKRMLRGSNVRWWIVGGWAIDAFTGFPRDHEDIDVSFFRADLPALLAHLSPRYCIWSNLSGTLKPLRQPADLLEGARQLWVRPDGGRPWVVDLAMNPHDGDDWIWVRDEEVRMPIDDATFEAADGIAYLRPELVLAMKARFARDKDESDLAAVLPLLDGERRQRMHELIARVHPGHRWLGVIEGAPS
jgi:Aminoglycoside-2''-adenylyltransferase